MTAERCPVCRQSGNFEFCAKVNLGYETDFDLIECPECEARFFDPMATEEQLAAFYRPQYYGSEWFKQVGKGMAYARSTLRRRKPGVFLDVGCGLGHFIKGIQENSEWKVKGVEFSPEAAAYAREELGLDVSSGQLADVQVPSKSFDNIHILNVLEHVPSPRELLVECRRIIKNDGLLKLMVPNGPVDSADLINYYKSSGRSGLSISGHLFFFSAKSLKRLFADTGFELYTARTLGFQRGLARLGLLPRSIRWKRACERKLDPNESVSPVISLAPYRHRPDIYYRYRHFRTRAQMLPGMRSFGLDFDLLLRPI